MSCLDNTDILRIVGGNSFQISITVKARRVADGSEIEDFDLSASSPVLNLIHAGEKTRKYFVTQGNQAIISFDGSEGLGYYGMEMSGSYNSEAWRFCIEKVLQLVDTNAKANIPEWSFLVDDTYFIEGTISIYGGGGGGDTVQADWTETNPTSAAFILHKPDLSVYATKSEVATGLANKQDTIVDLTSIRYGAAAGSTAYQKPGTGIPESDMSDGVQSSLDKADSAYQKPASGIPATDMSESVQASLAKANSAVQTESDPVFSGSPAADITQADINGWNAKQPAINDLSAIREGAAAGATAVQPDEMAQAIDEVDGDIADINAKIPTAASNLNQLADKAYVNSSIATNSATYRGSFNLITDLGMNVDATHAQIAGALATAIVTADNNDYAFVQIPDSASTPTVIAKIERYKHNGSGWVYEYDLNNSGFTAAQWAAINSGITSGLVGKLSDLPNNSELATLLNGKQNVINDLSTIRSGASAGATAIQPADLTDALNEVEAEIAGLDASKQDTIEDLSTIRSGAAAGATAYQKPVTGIPESDMSEGVQTSLGKADSSYQKPSSGIPSTDMSEGVQAALEKANSAVQTETDPVFSGSPAAEITQADINTWNAKQPVISDLADIREGAAAGATAVQPDEMAQAIDEVDGDIADINAKIPTAASNLNQLADKAYVNSSIATNSATYRGSFNLITDLGMNVDATHAQIAGALATAIATADNNDYAFVQIPDSASTPTVIAKIERYKHNGSGWVYEYDLNNSGFTAAQWAAINSGITSGLVGKLSDLPNNSELATLLNGKQNVISDLSAIRSGASAGATAVQPANLTEALNGVEDEIAGLDESKQDVIEDLSTIRSGAAAGATAYQKPGTGIPESDMSEGVQSALDKAEDAYQLPANGIPSTDMDADVQAALEKANSAVQTESDPVFSGSPAAEITQADINTWNAKQPVISDLADIREGAAAGATAVQPDEMAQAIDEVDDDIADINAKIPTAASNLNQLADKAYVNSSIATNSATYRGSFNLITDLGMNVDATHAQIAGALATAIATADNNDYAFVQIPDSASTPTVIAKIERYKHNGSGWVYEYDLNNSGFTSAQWAAINSGITSGLVGKLADLPNNSELATLLNGKQNVINDLSAIRSGASAGATAYQKPSGGIPASDMSSTVQQELSKANTAVQTETDPIFSASPAAGITAQNIQTWNGEPAARQAADTALQNSVSTLQTDLAAETSARQTADAALQTAIQDEATARATADTLLQQQYNALTQSDIIVGALPASGVANIIYRVPGTTDFTDYMWYDNQFVPMATYGLPISAEFVVDNNLNKTQEEVNEEVLSSLYTTIDLAEDTTWTDGYAIRGSNGYGYEASGFSYSDFIDISGYEKIVVKNIASSYYGSAFYREANSGTYIEGFGYGTQLPQYSDVEVAVPANAKYCRLTKLLSETSDNKQGVYIDVSTIDKAVSESEERINSRIDSVKSELDAKDAELSSEIDSINTQLAGLYVEKPLGAYGISIGTLKSGEAINVLIQDTTAQFVTLLCNGSSVSSFYKGIPSTYINTSGSEQALILNTNPNDVIKAIVQRPQQENADNAFCIPRSISLPASGNIYTGHSFYLKRGVKYSLEINDWVSPSTNQSTFSLILDGVTLMNLPVKKICLKPDLSGGSDFARLTIGGRIAEGHNATIILSNEDIEEQEAEITGLGGTAVSHTFGVNEGKKYYVDAKKWVSNDNESGQHFAITAHKKDGTTETPISKTTKVADYSGLYEIDTSNVLAITVSGRIKEGLTSVVKVYEKEKFSDIKIDVQGNGATYVQGSAEIWPGVYKATVSDWNAAASDGTSFYIYLKDVDNSTLAIKNVMKVARNFDGDYMIIVPDNYCEIHFDGRIINGMTAHIEMEKLESARDFPATRCNLDFPVLGCGRYSVQHPNCTYAHGGIVIFNEKYIFVQFFCSDAFYGENYYGTAGLSVIDKYSRSIRHIDVFSPRAIYLNGQLLEHTHIVMMVALDDYTVRICGTVKVNDVCTIINRTYDAENNILGDNTLCYLNYNGNTVVYDINNFITMVNTVYSHDFAPFPNKHAVDLPRLCKYNGYYYGAFGVDECLSDVLSGWNAHTFVIMKSADGITWEPVNCVTGDYQVTETGITFCDNKFFVIGRNESGHSCWYCVTDISGNVIKPMTLIPNSIHSMPTITTSRDKVYVMYNVTPDSGSHYTRTKCCFAEIGTTGNYELTVLKTYVDNNGINYFNMTTKPNGVILMSYITDPESYLSNDNPTSDICLAEINV